MFLIHYLNTNDNTTYFRIIKHNWYFEEGYINNNFHMILSIFYLDIDNNIILDYEEYKRLSTGDNTIPLKVRIINKLISFLNNLK